MCLNKKVIAGLAVAAVGIYLLAPGLFGAALPLLILSACPLSMLLMMRMMSRPAQGPSADTTSSPVDRDAELTELRAEVERLREEHRTGGGTSVGTPENT